MGIVRMPAMIDYWSKECYQWMPSHPICYVNGMTRQRFEFLWRHFHSNHATDVDFTVDAEEVENESDDDDIIVDQSVERVQREQDIMQSDFDIGDEDEEQQEEKQIEKQLWYHKVKPVVEHMRQKSLDLIYILGTYLALDEMMIRFCGRSEETHRIKNKPSKKGLSSLHLQQFVVLS